MILKGGKEAIHTNRVLHKIIGSTLEACGVPSQLIGLVETHADVEELLQIKEIDLIIPRGSGELVSKRICQMET